MSRFYSLVAAAAFSFLIVTSGCTPATSEPKPTAPMAPKMSLKESLEKASKLAAQLNQGFADGAGHDVVHDPLHQIGDLLSALPKQISSSEISDENKTALATAIDVLMNSYGKIDAKFHGGEGAEYADVKDEIEEALNSLDSVVGTMN